MVLYGVVDHYQSAGAWQADYGGAFISETTEMVMRTMNIEEEILL